MGNAYRDDLAAAQARVADLEREHTALVAQNAALEAAAAPPPKPHRSRSRLTGGEFAIYCVVLAAFITIFLLAGGPASWVKPLMIPVALGTQALLKVRRSLLEPAPLVEPVARLAAPPVDTRSEAEINQARLAAALKREADEKARREDAR
jgi:hypothetical protein